MALHFEVEVTELWDEQTRGPFLISAGMFNAYKADGTVVNDPLGNSFTCMSESSSLPMDMGPPTKASGWVVLDLPQDVTSVALDDYSTNSSGWEWNLPN